MLDTVAFWLDSADEDIAVAKLLLADKKNLYAGFFLHLITEKALKAVVADLTSGIPPKTHDLVRLSEYGRIRDELTDRQLDLLEELNPLNIEARYPEHKERIAAVLTNEKVIALFKETEALLCWIKNRLRP